MGYNLLEVNIFVYDVSQFKLNVIVSKYFGAHHIEISCHIFWMPLHTASALWFFFSTLSQLHYETFCYNVKGGIILRKFKEYDVNNGKQLMHHILHNSRILVFIYEREIY